MYIVVSTNLKTNLWNKLCQTNALKKTWKKFMKIALVLLLAQFPSLEWEISIPQNKKHYETHNTMYYSKHFF